MTPESQNPNGFVNDLGTGEASGMKEINSEQLLGGKNEESRIKGIHRSIIFTVTIISLTKKTA